MPEITARFSTAVADRYKIERHLGEGGMATVCLAEDLTHKRKVVIKLLPPEITYAVSPARRIPPRASLKTIPLTSQESSPCTREHVTSARWF